MNETELPDNSEETDTGSAPSPDENAPKTSSTVDQISEESRKALDHFEILSKIAEGGMGTIYRAMDLKLSKVVALKVLNPDCLDRTHLLRFQNEAKTLSRLSHPGIATVFDFGVADGQPFMAIEFVEGITLNEWLAEKGRLKLEEVLPLFLQICDVLAYAHKKGVVHRDVQPNNIMIPRQDNQGWRIKIVDFGIAKSMDEFDSGHLTRRGTWVGNPLFMSPEQSSGLPVTAQSDMYSFGCVIFFCLTGRPPFRGDTVLDTIIMHKESDVPSVVESLPQEEIPLELDNIIKRLLAKEPHDRYHSMEDIRNEFERIAGTDDNIVLFPQSDGSARQAPTSAAQPAKAMRTTIVVFVIVFSPVLFLVANTFIPFLKETPHPHPSQSQEVSSIRSKIKKGDTIYKLDGAGLTDSQLSGFAADNKAESIDLSGNRITSDGLRSLAGTKLHRLVLRDTLVQNLDDLPSKATLRSIDLGGTKIDDNTITALNSCPGLIKIDVSDTTASASGILKLNKLHPRQIFMNEPSARDLDLLQEAFPFCAFNKHDSFIDKFIRKTNNLADTNKGEQAYKKCEELLEKAKKTGNLELELFSMGGFPYFLDRMERYKEADAWWPKVIAFGEQYELRQELHRVYTMYFKRSLRLRRLQTAVAYAHKAINNEKEIEDNKLNVAETVSGLGYLLAAHGEPKAGIKLVEDSLRMQRELSGLDKPPSSSSSDSDPWAATLTSKQLLYARTIRQLGAAQYHDKQYKAARLSLDKALSLIGEVNSVVAFPDRILCYLDLADLEKATGNYKNALLVNDKCLSTLEQSSMLRKLYLLEALSQRSKILKQIGRNKEARAIEAEINRLSTKPGPRPIVSGK